MLHDVPCVAQAIEGRELGGGHCRLLDPELRMAALGTGHRCDHRHDRRHHRSAAAEEDVVAWVAEERSRSGRQRCCATGHGGGGGGGGRWTRRVL